MTDVSQAINSQIESLKNYSSAYSVGWWPVPMLLMMVAIMVTMSILMFATPDSNGNYVSLSRLGFLAFGLLCIVYMSYATIGIMRNFRKYTRGIDALLDDCRAYLAVHPLFCGQTEAELMLAENLLDQRRKTQDTSDVQPPFSAEFDEMCALYSRMDRLRHDLRQHIDKVYRDHGVAAARNALPNLLTEYEATNHVTRLRQLVDHFS